MKTDWPQINTSTPRCSMEHIKCLEATELAYFVGSPTFLNYSVFVFEYTTFYT